MTTCPKFLVYTFAFRGFLRVQVSCVPLATHAERSFSIQTRQTSVADFAIPLEIASYSWLSRVMQLARRSLGREESRKTQTRTPEILCMSS